MSSIRAPCTRIATFCATRSKSSTAGPKRLLDVDHHQHAPPAFQPQRPCLDPASRGEGRSGSSASLIAKLRARKATDAGGNRHQHLAVQLAVREAGVLGAALVAGLAHLPGRPRGPRGRGSPASPARGSAPAGRRSQPPAVKRSTSRSELEHAGQDQVRVENGERRLEAGHPHRRLLEGHLLLLARVRSVVGGDAADHARPQAVDQRVAVRLAPQRRVHLEARVERAHGLVGQSQVMRGHLSRDLRPGAARALDRCNGFGAREMEHVAAPSFVERDRRVPLDHRALRDRRDPGEPEQGRDRPLVHHAVLRQGGILLVEGEHAAAQPLVLEGLPQQARVRDRHPVVGEARRSLVDELRHLGQLLAAEALCSRRRGTRPERAPRAGRARTASAGPTRCRQPDPCSASPARSRTRRRRQRACPSRGPPRPRARGS